MQPLIWLGILALLLVVEAITAGLTTIWFAGGALVAAIACYAGANLTVQILLFLCVSLVLLIFTRPLAMKYFNKETIQTNANSLIGKKGESFDDLKVRVVITDGNGNSVTSNTVNVTLIKSEDWELQIGRAHV